MFIKLTGNSNLPIYINPSQVLYVWSYFEGAVIHFGRGAKDIEVKESLQETMEILCGPLLTSASLRNLRPNRYGSSPLPKGDESI